MDLANRVKSVLQRLREEVPWGNRPRWQWHLGHTLIGTGAFFIAQSIVLFFTPNLKLAISAGIVASVLAAWYAEKNDPPSIDQVNDLTTYLTLPVFAATATLLNRYVGLAVAIPMIMTYLRTLPYSKES